VGDRSALPTDLGAALRASGLVHLLALSGLHVAWLAALARGLAAALGLGLRARALAGAGCAVLYAVIAGPLPSLMRAVVAELLLPIARMHALSWAGVLANLLAVPVSGLLLSAAWLAAVTEAVWPGSGHRWFAACEALSAALRAITAAAARLPGALAT